MFTKYLYKHFQYKVYNLFNIININYYFIQNILNLLRYIFLDTDRNDDYIDFTIMYL